MEAEVENTRAGTPRADAPGATAADKAAEHGPGAPHPPPGEAFGHLGRQVGELKEFAAYYVTTQLDRLRLSVRSAGIYAALGIIGFVAFAAIVSAGAVLMLIGAAWGLGILFGGRLWLGSLVVGVAVLGMVGLGAWMALAGWSRSFRNKTVEKYEQRQSWQRTHYGRDVRDAASGAKKSR